MKLSDRRKADEQESWGQDQEYELENANKALRTEFLKLKGADNELIETRNKLEAETRNMRILHKLSALLTENGDLYSVLPEILEAAIAVTGADRGNVQLLDLSTGNMEIAAQKGFDFPFLIFPELSDRGEIIALGVVRGAVGGTVNGNARGEQYGTAHEEVYGTAREKIYGAAPERMERFVVEDITQSPIFLGSDALDIFLDEGIRAFQSIPLVSLSGRLLGIIFTYFGDTHTPVEHELVSVDILARLAADIIERKEEEKVLCQGEQQVRLKYETVFSTSRGATGQETDNLELAEIVDVQAIQSLMDDFYKLTNIPTGLNDLKGNVLAGIGWQEICTRFHRGHAEACKHCVESNIKLSMGVAPGEFKLFKCANNMWDISTPIVVGGQQVGILFSGQFFFEDEPLDYELFRSQAEMYGFDKEEYLAALGKVPRLSKETVNTGMAFLTKLANMISQLSYSNIKLARSLEERDSLVSALRESETRYRMLFDHNTDALILSDPRGTGKILSANPAACKMLGWKEEELIGKGRDLMFDLEDPAVSGVLDELIRSGSTKAQLIYRRKDGTTFPGEMNSAFFTDSNGEPRVVIIIRDITERKKAGEALRLSNLYNRSLIEASLDPLVTIGPDGKITDVNGATEQVTGYSRTDLIGTDFSDYFTEPEKARAGYRQVFTDGKVWDYPLEIRHRDGSITPVLYNASVYRGENGKVIGVFAAARDITERKKAEKALKKVHGNLEKLVEARTKELEKAYNRLKESEKGLAEAQRMAHIGNWSWNIATDELLWSDEVYRIFGLDPQELKVTYELFLNHVHPEDREYLLRAINEGLKGTPYTVDYRIVLDNGKERIIHTEAEVISYEGNTPVRVKGIVQDITERKIAERELENINRIRIKEIHHRIKNNLQVISSLLDLQAEKFRNREVLEAFRESQNRVLSMSLIHEELYKGEGTDKLNFSIYVRKLAEGLFETYSIHGKNISLLTDLEENAFFDMDTAIPLGIIVNELVSNSLKHAFGEDQEGEVRIRLRREKVNVDVKESLFSLTISDNGKGIPEKIDLKEVDSLGLQLISILVNQLDGNIKLNRKHGTEFLITFITTERP